MAGENAASGEAKTVQLDDGGEGRERSTIGFPYNNLSDATEVAQAIHDNVGTGECDANQLSAWMNLSPKSSGFRVQLSAARMFGVIDQDALRLSALGRMIVDPLQARAARAKAFLNVPLYSAVYEKYKSGVLPPAAALERDIVSLGVAEKQKERARQVFERSADQAGFFEHGKNRLVMPGIAAREAVREQEKKDPPSGGGGNGGGADLVLDPLLVALLKKIPAPGLDWPAQQRLRWFRTFAMNVSQIYDADSDSPVELKIELESDI